MNVIARDSKLWNYLAPEIQELVEDGEIVLNFVHDNKDKADISDFSFMVFPFAKSYEGFLKRFLLDIRLVSEEDYYGEEIRIGRILSPNYKEKDSLFDKLEKHSPAAKGLPKKLWLAWKRGRNLVFHYFPMNHRRLSYEDALDLINQIVDAMYTAVKTLDIR